MNRICNDRFEPGRLVATPGALDAIPRAEWMDALHRHLQGDWGDVSAADKKRNDYALLHGDRMISQYCSSNNRSFWIITEADRSATMILLPEEY